MEIITQRFPMNKDNIIFFRNYYRQLLVKRRPTRVLYSAAELF